MTVREVPYRALMDQVLEVVFKRRGRSCAAVVAVHMSSGASEYDRELEPSDGDGRGEWLMSALQQVLLMPAWFCYGQQAMVLLTYRLSTTLCYDAFQMDSVVFVDLEMPMCWPPRSWMQFLLLPFNYAWEGNLTEKPKRSSSTHIPRVRISNSGRKPHPVSPFAAVQSTPTEPDMGNGHIGGM
eukprot:scaffold111311_cov15-Tisochrysis_lutea.AAC.1